MLPRWTPREKVSGWLAEVMESPEYKNAKGFGKVKVLGQEIWDWLAGWWEKNKAGITKKITEGINWLGDVAPGLLDPALRARLAEAKGRAALRQAESALFRSRD